MIELNFDNLKAPYPFVEGEHYVVDPVTGCWNWIKGKGHYGYGQIKRNGKTLKAHRLSYEHYNGPIKNGLFCCHICDNPSCINPDHLFVGTPSDNSRDREAKNRHPSKKFTNTALMLYGRLNPGWSYERAGKFFGVSDTSVLRRVQRHPEINFGR